MPVPIDSFLVALVLFVLLENGRKLNLFNPKEKNPYYPVTNIVRTQPLNSWSSKHFKRPAKWVAPWNAKKYFYDGYRYYFLYKDHNGKFFFRNNSKNYISYKKNVIPYSKQEKPRHTSSDMISHQNEQKPKFGVAPPLVRPPRMDANAGSIGDAVGPYGGTATTGTVANTNVNIKQEKPGQTIPDKIPHQKEQRPKFGVAPPLVRPPRIDADGGLIGDAVGPYGGSATTGTISNTADVEQEEPRQTIPDKIPHQKETRPKFGVAPPLVRPPRVDANAGAIADAAASYGGTARTGTFANTDVDVSDDSISASTTAAGVANAESYFGTARASSSSGGGVSASLG